MAENDQIKAETAVVEQAEVTKTSIRRKVWEHLEKNKLVNFPRPVYGRIPNFKGCELAAAKVVELDEFKSAQNIKVNPDKPQEPVRFAVLEHQKHLFVPIPRLASGLLKHILLPEDCNKEKIRQCVSRKGIEESGKDVGIADDVKIDLVVLGSVAVSREGYRIGKGKGYADLEFAILTHMKAVHSETLVVTTIHDSQLYDSIPSALFGPHDVPVDIIVTPTEVIRVEKRLPKPTGVFWNLVSQRRLDLMPVLKALREIDQNNNIDVELKDVDSDVEANFSNRRRPFRRQWRPNYNARRQKNNSQSAETNGIENADSSVAKPVTNEDGAEGGEKPNTRKKNNFKKRYNRRKEESGGDSKENKSPKSEQSQTPEHKRRPKRYMRKNHPQIDFSLVIRNINRSVRVRDLKGALTERGIKPNIITWRGYKGFCCLHFSKTNPNTISDREQQSHGVDSVLTSLSDLNIESYPRKPLVVEIMKPISRIETTDVTAV